MLFSSLLFLYLFLPISLLGYYLINKNYRNYWLLLVSLIFFAWGGPSFTLILIGSIILNKQPLKQFLHSAYSRYSHCFTDRDLVLYVSFTFLFSGYLPEENHCTEEYPGPVALYSHVFTTHRRPDHQVQRRMEAITGADPQHCEIFLWR
jgi:D-alanyl-lipoteichoic acid acyltransferase DltB (MBOAT superfamily)